ncbi:unnamed protein product [Amaranthus hypochondriacus]
MSSSFVVNRILYDYSSSSDDDEYVDSNCSSEDDKQEEEEEESKLELAIQKLSILDYSRKDKLIVLSLNGLLIHRVHSQDRSRIPRNRSPDGVYNRATRMVYKRPFLDEFLKFCLDRFEVGIWSSAQEHNVDDVMHVVFKGLKTKFLFIWDQEECTYSGFKSLEKKEKPLFFKELSKLYSSLAKSSGGSRFSESNTLLIDDKPYKGLLNSPYNGIFLESYDPNDARDNVLDPKKELGQYLEGLANAKDVQTYVKENSFGQGALGPHSPNWNFYAKVYRVMKNKDFGSTGKPKDLGESSSSTAEK